MLEIVAFLGGYGVQLAATSLLLSRILQRKSIYGLSMDTQVCYLIALLSRCYWSQDTRLFETPLAYAEIVGSVVVTVICCAACIKLRKTASHSKAKKPRIFYRWPCLVGMSMMLAILWHPGRYTDYTQVLVSFTMYLEAMALLPQLSFMRKFEEIEGLTTCYVWLLALSRVIRLLFWVCLFVLGDRFLGLFISDIVHTLLIGQYLFYYYKNLKPCKGYLDL